MQCQGSSKWDTVDVEDEEMEIEETQVQETETLGGVSSLVNSNQDDGEDLEREEATEGSMPATTANSVNESNVNESICCIKGCMLLLDCVTRWGSTSKMIARAVKMEAAIEQYTLKYWSNGVSDYRISQAEWSTLKDINSILEPFSGLLTLSVSEKTPSLPFVVPYTAA